MAEGLQSTGVSPGEGAARGGVAIDPRTRAVHEKLYAAAERLGSSGETCTVSSLVRAAEVSRSVFYVHFADLADFARHMQQDRLDEIEFLAGIELPLDPGEAMWQACQRLVGHVGANRALYQTAFALTGTAGLAEGTTDSFAAAFGRRIAESGTLPSGLTAALVSGFLAHAFAGLLAAWIGDPDAADEDVLAHHLFAMIPTWVYVEAPATAGTSGGTERRRTR